MKKLLKLIITAALFYPLAELISGCSEEADCSGTARPMMQCNLYTIDRESGVIAADTLESLTITALGSDSVVINNQQNVKELSLPLRYAADSTELVFHYSNEKQDTVTVFHTNTPYFLSIDCGYQMKQVITGIRYTRTLLDSIYIKNTEAGIYGTENLKIFY